jgi:hypothetical protein
MVGHHQDVILFVFTVSSPFVAASSLQFQGNKKTLLTTGKQGGRNLGSILYLLTPELSKFPSGRIPPEAMDSLGLNAQP